MCKTAQHRSEAHWIFHFPPSLWPAVSDKRADFLRNIYLSIWVIFLLTDAIIGTGSGCQYLGPGKRWELTEEGSKFFFQFGFEPMDQRWHGALCRENMLESHELWCGLKPGHAIWRALQIVKLNPLHPPHKHAGDCVVLDNYHYSKHPSLPWELPRPIENQTS